MVVLIIAILIAVLIPTFVGAKQRAQDRAMQSSMRNALTAAKVVYSDHGDYTEATVAGLAAVEPSTHVRRRRTTSPGPNVVSVDPVEHELHRDGRPVEVGNVLLPVRRRERGGVGVQYAKGAGASCTASAAPAAGDPSWAIDLVATCVGDESRCDAWHHPDRGSAPDLRCSVVTAFIAVVAGVYGLVVGSFLNVVIWRVPRHESIVKPRSHCPACDTPIATRDNIPVVSWLMLRGRCRHCGEPISIRYPFIELLTGVLFAAVGARYAHSWALPAFLVLTAGADRDLGDRPRALHHPEPDRVPGRLSRVWCCSRSPRSSSTTGRRSGGRCSARSAAFTFFFVLHLVAPGGMGFGDVRLSFVLGLFLGWLGWPYVLGGLFAGFLYGAVIGMRADRGRAPGPAPAHPVRAVPGRRHDDLRALRRPARRLVARPGSLTARRSTRVRQSSEVRPRIVVIALQPGARFDDCCSCTSPSNQR